MGRVGELNRPGNELVFSAEEPVVLALLLALLAAGLVGVTVAWGVHPLTSLTGAQLSATHALALSVAALGVFAIPLLAIAAFGIFLSATRRRTTAYDRGCFSAVTTACPSDSSSVGDFGGFRTLDNVMIAMYFPVASFRSTADAFFDSKAPSPIPATLFGVPTRPCFRLWVASESIPGSVKTSIVIWRFVVAVRPFHVPT